MVDDAARGRQREAGQRVSGVLPCLEGQRRERSLSGPSPEPVDRNQEGFLARRAVVDLGEVGVDDLEQADLLETGGERWLRWPLWSTGPRQPSRRV